MISFAPTLKKAVEGIFTPFWVSPVVRSSSPVQWIVTPGLVESEWGAWGNVGKDCEWVTHEEGYSFDTSPYKVVCMWEATW